MLQLLDASGKFDVPSGDLSIAVVDSAAIARLHGDYLGDPSPTDVITFDGDGTEENAGEICVCADVALAYARAHRGDPARELLLYVIHGYLHLAGFDDRTPHQRRRMRAAERAALRLVAADSP